jgi:Na+/proline symporter
MEVDPLLRWLLAITIVVYMIVMYWIGYIAQRKIQNEEDFLVAGRRLPLSLAWMTLLATWFGAGTMLTAADEVREGGLQRAALDPWGAGVCLILASFLVAGPMWRMKLLTVPDFFGRRYGKGAEMISSLIMVPSYFGWVAAQFTALAEIFHLFFDLPVVWGILLVAIVGTGYTLMGGMWSVTLTDAVQITLVLAGLVVLLWVVLWELRQGDPIAGWHRIGAETEPNRLQWFPREDGVAMLGWLGVFAIGALGNLPGQDLMQRVFASNSEQTAKRACLVSGVVYLFFGTIPLVLALGANLLFPDTVETKVLPTLAHAFLHPAVAVIFVVALLSAILSTIDSAILSPASVLAQNVFPRLGWHDTLRSNRVAVLLVALCSLALAYAGSSSYELLEEAYLLTMVGLFVPLMFGLYTRVINRWAGGASMIAGTLVWGIHFVCGWEDFLEPAQTLGWIAFPLSLGATACSLLAYFLWEPPWRMRWTWRTEDQPESDA